MDSQAWLEHHNYYCLYPLFQEFFLQKTFQNKHLCLYFGFEANAGQMRIKETEKKSLLLSPSLTDKDSFPESQKQHSNQTTAIPFSSFIHEETARTLVAK